MTENPFGVGSLGDLVDFQSLQDQDHHAAQQAEQEAQNAWREDNVWVHDYIHRAVDGLNFEGIVENKREILHSLPSFRDEQMAVRTLSWIPDASQETRATDEPRIRAVYGHAVLLSSKCVDGEFLDESEKVDSIFYALGVAVEREDQLQFYQMTAPDSGQHRRELYSVLTEGKYTSAIHGYHSASGKAFWKNMDLTVAIMRASSQEVPEEILEKDRVRREDHNRLAGSMEDSFRRKMREIGETPTESSSIGNTQAVQRLLLGNPQGKKPTSSEKVKGGQRQMASAPTYIHHTQPLLDWGLGVRQQLLAESFDTFLLTNPAIIKAAKR